MTIDPSKPKLRSEYILFNDGKERVRKFFEERMIDFELSTVEESKKRKAQQDLQDLLSKDGPDGKAVLPPELIDELTKCFRGESDLAILIRNFPEREYDEKRFVFGRNLVKEATYCYHIGEALYAIAGVQRITSQSLRRTKGDMEIAGDDIHRDSLPGDKKFGEYVIFSCPYNIENAVIDVVYLRKALESFSPKEREQIHVNMQVIGKGGHKERWDGYNLNTLLEKLDTPLTSYNFVKRVELARDTPPELRELFTQHIAEKSIGTDLQPGDILAVNENTMFHQGRFGKQPENMRVGQTTRLILHQTGAPLEQSRRI